MVQVVQVAQMVQAVQVVQAVQAVQAVQVEVAQVVPLAERHGLGPEVLLRRPRHRVLREVALHPAVVERVVQRGHDHRLVEHQVAVAHRAGRRVDSVEKAAWTVDARVARTQFDLGQDRRG